MLSVIVGRDLCVSTFVPPCPGKCFAQAITPAACIPRAISAPKRATVAASVPKLRLPMAGLPQTLSTSTTGARS